MYLYCVRIRGLAEDLQEGGIGDEEEAREDEPLLLQVAGEGLLAQFQLLQEMGQQLTQHLVAHTAAHHTGGLVRARHDLHPALVDTLEPLRFLERERRVRKPGNRLIFLVQPVS